MEPRLPPNRPAARSSMGEARPLQPQPQNTSEYRPPTPSDYPPKPQKSSKRRYGLYGLALLPLLLFGGLVGWHKFGPTPGVDTSKYQAVFLDNDQVYFGKIADISQDTLVLTDVYYLQNQAPQQSAGQANKSAANPTNQASNLTLVKLGNELHAPEDTMRINMDQVMFWENLKEDGKVSQGIKNYKP